MTLDAGPRAHERVGHIYQSVFGFALREQILLGRKDEPSHGGVARVPQRRQVFEILAARVASTDENVVVQALEPVWKSNFGRPTSARRITSLFDFHTGRLEPARPRHDAVRDGARRHRRDVGERGEVNQVRTYDEECPKKQTSTSIFICR